MENSILQYIPQRPPMVMVSALVEADEVQLTSEFRIQGDNLFLEDGLMNGNGLIENIAQTAAAHAGYNALKNNQPVKKGFIAGIKDFKVYSFPKPGEIIRTRIEVMNRVMDFTIIEGTVFCEDQLIASCEMRIFTLAD